MKDVVLNEVKKELNWKERIIVKILGKTMKKVYTEGVKKDITGIAIMFVKLCCPVEAPEEE